MKRISKAFIGSLVIILIFGTTLAASLQAQDNAILVHVSFPFNVGAQTIPSGTYQFSLESSHFLLCVRNVKTGDTETFDVRPERQSVFEQKGRLIFRNSADRRVLAEVHFPGFDTFSELIPQRNRNIETLNASANGQGRSRNAERSVQQAVNRSE